MVSLAEHIALSFAIVSIVTEELQTQIGDLFVAEVSRSAAWSSVHMEARLYLSVSVCVCVRVCVWMSVCVWMCV